MLPPSLRNSRRLMPSKLAFIISSFILSSDYSRSAMMYSHLVIMLVVSCLLSYLRDNNSSA